MISRSCCNIRTTSANRRRPVWSIAEWLVPSLLLAFIPKCPMCVAAYVALATGMSVSFATASWLRLLLIAIGVIALSFVAIKTVRHLRHANSTSHPS